MEHLENSFVPNKRVTHECFPRQLEQLSEVLVTKFDDKGVELDRVVKFNLGTGLFVDYAGPGSPFRTVVA